MQTEGQSRHALPPGTVLNGVYRVEAELGQGGFGIVYRAHHTELDYPVAIKEYLPAELAIREGRSVHPRSADCREHFQEGMRRFLEEAKQLIAFRSHPNIVSCRDFFRGNGTAYLVMEYEEGLPLSELLRAREKEGRPFKEEDLRKVMVPLLEGLRQVHEAGVLHRDIKPGNILVRRKDERPVLIDFGAAKQNFAERSKSLAPFTEGYAAIEQVGEGKLGPWTDLYGAGAVMWRMVAGGKRPYEPPNPVKVESRTHAVLRGESDPMPSARELGRGRFSERVLGAIDKCLELREADRVQGCAELLGLLDSEGERGEGRQKFTDADGSVWEGPLVDGQRQGHWVARRADGTVGEGPFVDGQRHGDWVWRFADGSVYDLSYMTGKWVSSVRRGVAPVASEPRPAEEPSAVPTGIGGWLAFPMLGLIMSPISIMAISLSTYVPIFSKGTWEVVTTSGSEAYHPLWAPLLIFEILGNSCLLIFSIVLIVLFFRRHYLLPKLIIIVYAASLAFQGIDFFASALISTVAKELDPGSLSRAIFWTAIWIPYFMKSQRVRNTFTNGERHGRWRSIADRGVYIAAALVILAVVVILGLIFSDPQFVKNPDRDRSPLPRTITGD